jgi:hypothetical protein
VSGDLPEPRFRIKRMGRRSLLKPQHRIVLGLVAMSAGALLITLLNPARDEAGPSVSDPAGPVVATTRPPTPGTTPGARAEVPVPAVRSAGDATPAALQARARLLGAAVAACATEPAGFAPADGRLDLVVELGSAGLDGAFVDGIPGLGDGAAACLAAGLGAAAWPAAEPPTAVRVPFYVVQPVGRTEPPPGGDPAGDPGAPGTPPAEPASP